MTPQDLKILALIRDSERYIFIYSEDQRTELLRTLGRFAACPELSLSWTDAAFLSQRVRLEAAECEGK